MEAKKRLLLSLAMFLLVFLIGVIGFKILGGEEWTFFDALYMTVITLSTVGYGEVSDLSANPAARTFAIVFIILCLGTIAFAVSSITSFIVEGELKNILGRKRMEKKVAKLKDHYIVCGTDETAHTIIDELILTKRDFVVVDPSIENLERIAALGDLLTLQGDPSEDEVLIGAGIEKARGVLLSLPTDEANLFVTITARSLSPDVRIVTKGIDPRSHKKIRKAGANAVISPTFIGGMRMVSEMIRPVVVSFLDLMLRERGRVLRFEEVFVQSGSPVVGKTLMEMKFHEKTGALLVAIRRRGKEEFDFNPGPSIEIQDNDVLIFIASPDMMIEVKKIVESV
ncbi:MAG: NAD-binding protein [Candidatus Aminicenantes bacterium]|nr:NAD-binding protein [Candidatus Aminicenantes bacterium]